MIHKDEQLISNHCSQFETKVVFPGWRFNTGTGFSHIAEQDMTPGNGIHVEVQSSRIATRRAAFMVLKDYRCCTIDTPNPLPSTPSHLLYRRAGGTTVHVDYIYQFQSYQNPMPPVTISCATISRLISGSRKISQRQHSLLRNSLKNGHSSLFYFPTSTFC